ncbi:hypothetical protein KR084_006827 [Drosophila pseudotakahashii]|nr:hypothetical protein KR084_006827 [Drosophila pseudotakahashii]
MKFVAILLLSSLTIAMVLAFPSNDNEIAAVPVDNLHAGALASPADSGSADTSTSADQISNSLRSPRHLLSKLFQPNVVVQPVIVEQRFVPAQYPAYSQPYPGIYGQGRRYY